MTPNPHEGVTSHEGIKLVPEPERRGIDLSAERPIIRNEGRVRSSIDRASFAAAESGLSKEHIAQYFWTGHEQRLREQVAMQESMKNRRRRYELVNQLLRDSASGDRPLSSEEQQFIMNVEVEEPLNPSTILEQLYARRAIEEASVRGTNDNPTEYEEAVQEDPDEAERIKQGSMDYMTKQEIAKTVLAGVQDKYDNTGWGRWGVDLLKSMVPFYTWSNITDRLGDIKTSSWLTGSNVQEQLRGLYFLPADEFQERLQAAVDEIAESNVLDAVYFAQAALAYSNSSELWDNIFFGLDTVDLATLGAVGALGTARYARKTRSVATANARPDVTEADRLAATGDLKASSEARVQQRLEQVGAADPNTLTPPQRIEQIYRGNYGYFDPENITRNAGELGAERARRIEEALTRQRDILMKDLEATHIQRMGPEATARAFARAEEVFRRTNHKLEDAIVEVRPVNQAAEAFGGVDHIEVLLGRKDATSFARPSQAQFYAERMYRLPEGSYNVVEREGNWFLSVTRTVDETDLSVTPFRLGTENTAPENWVNTWISYVRNPDNIVSQDHGMWRKVSTYGANGTLARMAEAAQAMGKLSSNEADRLRDVMDSARFQWRTVTNPDGTQTQVQGRFYHSQRELETEWMKRHNSLPNERESLAYWTFRQMMDYDHAVKNLSVYRDKARMGIHQHSVGMGFRTEDGKFMYRNTPFFEGRVLDQLPTSGDFTVAWHNMKNGKTDFGIYDRLFPNQRQVLQEMIESGDAKIIQVVNPSDPAFRNFVNSGGEPVQYIVVRDVKTKPLDVQQVAYNEGGHWIYPSGGAYIKQARTHKTRFNRRMYDNDITAHHQPVPAQAARFADAYNEARQMIRAGVDDATLDDFVSRNLPYRSGEELRKLFRSADNPDAPFDLDTPFVVTQPGQRAGDVMKLDEVFGEPVVDAARSPHSLSGRINTQYAQERGERLTSIRQSGTEANPVFKLDGAPLLDSYEALARSSSQLARNRFLDDYKHRAIEDWAQQFADVLDVSREALMADPMRYLREPVWKSNVYDKNQLAAAKNNRRAILNFLNIDTADTNAWKWSLQKVVDGIYRRTGDADSRLISAANITADTDPATVARTMVFHPKLGMLNPVQFPLQGLAVIHAAAIDGNPIRAAQANFLYWSMRTRGLAETNQKAQSFLGRATARALGVSEDIVEEMYDAWKRSGMHIVEGEYSRLDDYLNPQMFHNIAGTGSGAANAGRKALNTGKFFFNEGNNMHRGTSFATAFLRWRSDNPTARLTNEALAHIQNRADLMYINMSRASNPAMQQGMASVPTQFFAYHARMMEQMLSKQLTMGEKIRLMTVYSAMWGVPVGTAGMFAGAVWPAHDAIRQEVMEQGIDIDGDAVTKFLMEGGASMLIEYATGMNFDLGNRMGPGGMSWLRDLLDGQFLEVVTGASGSFIGDMLEKMNPFAWHATQVFAEDSENFPVKTQDFVDVLKGMSLVNNSIRAYWAYNAGQWLDGRDRLVAEFDGVSASAALMMVVTGSTPQEVADMYIQRRSMAQEDTWKRTLEREVSVNYRRALKAAANGDDATAYDYFKRAYIIMQGSGYTPMERAAVGRRILQEHGPLMEQTAREFAKRDPELRLQRWLDREFKED